MSAAAGYNKRMQLVVDGLLTHYQLSGKGKVVLLLHGWGDSSQGVAALQMVLAKHYRVIALDLPGFGKSQGPETVWDLDDYAHFLKHALDKLELQQLYAVIGHSNGGALAIRAIALQALQPDKLVLLAASGIRTGGNFRRLVLKVIAKTGDIATLWLPERYRRSLRQSLYGAAGSDMLVVPKLQETFKQTVRQDVQADAATIAIPALLIYAEADQAIPVSDGRKYHSLIKNSELHIIKQAGHFVHLDQPAQVTALIETFLQ
jgi:pimeloyl-ACP methyl ester carboxylesterase